MGIRMNQPEIELGNDCGHCSYDPNEVWPPGQTPNLVYVTFHGMNLCPGFSMLLPNGRSFKCYQDPDYPCIWISDGPVWHCKFSSWTVSNYSEILLVYLPDNKLAFQGTNPICPFEFHGFNNLIGTCSSFVCATDGIAVPSWGELPNDLMDDMGLEFSQGTFYEVLPISVDSIVHRFAIRKDSTCVKIKT